MKVFLEKFTKEGISTLVSIILGTRVSDKQGENVICHFIFSGASCFVATPFPHDTPPTSPGEPYLPYMTFVKYLVIEMSNTINILPFSKSLGKLFFFYRYPNSVI